MKLEVKNLTKSFGEKVKMVTDGTDQGGISKAQNWKGGNGFKFYELAPMT